MRITALYIAVVCIVLAIVPRRWAHSDMEAMPEFRMSEDHIQVGLRGFVEISGYESREEPLHELNMEGHGFEAEGLAVFVLGIVAAIACAAASMIIRRRELGRARLLVVPLAAFFVMTIVFVARLEKFGYLSLGWAPWVALCGTLLGAAAMLAPGRIE